MSVPVITPACDTSRNENALPSSSSRMVALGCAFRTIALKSVTFKRRSVVELCLLGYSHPLCLNRVNAHSSNLLSVFAVGASVGASVGSSCGDSSFGLNVGRSVGGAVGSVGDAVGWDVVGIGVGWLVGANVGL
jgi:hypothetical protein